MQKIFSFAEDNASLHLIVFRELRVTSPPQRS